MGWFDEQRQAQPQPPMRVLGDYMNPPQGGGFRPTAAQRGGFAPTAPSGPAPMPQTGGTGAAQGGDPQQWQALWDQLTAGKPPTRETMQAAVAEMQRRGIPVTIATRAGGSMPSDDKIVLPNGQVVDVLGNINPQTGRGDNWAWRADPYDFFGADRQVVLPNGQIGNYGDYLKSQGRAMPNVPQAPPGYGQGGGANLPPGYSTEMGGGEYPLYNASGPGLMQPFGATFNIPTGTDDPGFAFAMQQGQQAIERSAAAKGTLLTGGTLKDLASFSTGMALQGYGDAYNRAWQRYTGAEGIFNRNRQFQFGSLADVAGMGLNAATNAAGVQQGIGNVQAAGTVGRANAVNQTVGNLANLGQQYAVNRALNPAQQQQKALQLPNQDEGPFNYGGGR